MISKRHNRYFPWIPWAILLLLPACATTIPSEALNGVDYNISFENLGNDPDAFVGKTVVFGGEILQTENRPGETLLMILQHNLDGDLKPLQNDQSEGRFIAIVQGFLDPAIYTEGRRITVVGTVTGKEIRPLNEIPYVYPVVKKNHLYLWPVPNAPDSEPRVIFGIGIGIGSYGY